MGIINSDEFAIVGTANGGELLKPYDVEISGHKTTVKLTDADARRRGLLDEKAEDDAAELRQQVAELKAKLAETETKERDAVEAKEKAETELAEAKTETEAHKAKSAANKQAPTPQNKGAAAEASKA